MADTDDGARVARAKTGDRGAFGELVVRHQRATLAIARAYFASEADAEDAVQEAFVKAFQRLGDLADDSRFAAWLARITSNACLVILRARTDKVSLADFASTVRLRPRVGHFELTPAALASKGEQLRAAVGRLTEDQRVVLMLRYTADMTYSQMAAYLDLPASTVRGRLRTAKETVRGMLSTVGDAR